MSSHEERMAGFARRWQPRGEGMTAGARRAVAVLFLVTLALAGANLLFTVREVSDVARRAAASCKFNSDLGTAPVVAVPPARKPGLLGVTIISDARVAWHGMGCPGKLAPPGPGFVKWARYYHLPVG